MSTVSIREVRELDYEGIAAVRADSLDVPPETLAGRFRTELSHNIGSNSWQMFVAEADGVIVGYGRCEFYDAQNGDCLYGTQDKLPTGWYLRGVVVAKKFQRRKIALLLSKTRLEWLSFRTSKIHCFLDSDEKVSIPLYLTLGFQIVSRNWKFEDPKRTDTGILLLRV